MQKLKALILEANRWSGIVEQDRNNAGQMVQMFQQQIGGAVDEPWCMSFVQYCCHWVDQFFPESKHMLFPSEHCMTVWAKTPSICKSKEPFTGAVIIWNYKGTYNGHTGIVRNVKEKHIMTIEGNTGDNVKRVVREGDGVYVKRRLINRSYKDKMQIIGYLNPWPHMED